MSLLRSLLSYYLVPHWERMSKVLETERRVAAAALSLIAHVADSTPAVKSCTHCLPPQLRS